MLPLSAPAMARSTWSLLALALLLAGCRTTNPIDVVQAELDAYNAQDLDAFVSMFADDVVVTNTSGLILIQGKAALRERYGTLFKSYPRNRCRVVARRIEGDRVVIHHEIITGRGPEKPDPWDLGWVAYEVENGLIRRIQLP
jgi:hypothetical protein